MDSISGVNNLNSASAISNLRQAEKAGEIQSTEKSENDHDGDDAVAAVKPSTALLNGQGSIIDKTA